MNRRSLLRYAALAPLAPVIGAISSKLGSVSQVAQKVTPQMAVQELTAAYARTSNPAGGITSINSVRYIGEHLAVVRFTHRAIPLGQLGQGALVTAINKPYQYTGRMIFNASSEVLKYAGQIIPPGVWREIMN